MKIARRKMALLVCSFLMAATLSSAAQNSTQNIKTLAAQRADTIWLALVDSGQYAQSWKEAGAVFQAGISQEKWADMVKQVRDPLGKLVTRRLKSASYSTTLPGVPDGEYEVIIFETSFEHKQLGYETVITSVQKDGAWRVVGYYIK